MGSWGGGSNLTLVTPRARSARSGSGASSMLRRRPERRKVALTSIGPGPLRREPPRERPRPTRRAGHAAGRRGRHSTGPATGRLLFGGDLNLRPGRRRPLRRARRRHRARGPDRARLDRPPARPGPRDRRARLAHGRREAREVTCDGLAIRLSDHAPVSARFASRDGDGLSPESAIGADGPGTEIVIPNDTATRRKVMASRSGGLGRAAARGRRPVEVETQAESVEQRPSASTRPAQAASARSAPTRASRRSATRSSAA